MPARQFPTIDRSGSFDSNFVHCVPFVAIQSNVATSYFVVPASCPEPMTTGPVLNFVAAVASSFAGAVSVPAAAVADVVVAFAAAAAVAVGAAVAVVGEVASVDSGLVGCRSLRLSCIVENRSY